MNCRLKLMLTTGLFIQLDFNSLMEDSCSCGYIHDIITRDIKTTSCGFYIFGCGFTANSNLLTFCELMPSFLRLVIILNLGDSILQIL